MARDRGGGERERGVDSVTRDAILFADAGLAPARLSDTELKAELLRALTLYLRLEED